MDAALSDKGTLMRYEAAAALAILLREVCETARVFTFSNHLVECANLRGLAMIQGIWRSQGHGGTYLGNALRELLHKTFSNKTFPARIVVVTDEQSADTMPALPPITRGYIVNVAPYRTGLELSGAWTRVNGFSERVVDFIRYEESAD